MTIDVEAFGLYLVITLVIVGAFMWALSPLFRPEKKEEPKLDPVQEPVVNKAQEEVKVNIDSKTEEAFVKAMETEAKVETPAVVKKTSAKKPATKAPAKKAPAKKVTKK
jgi:hypothetical protein